ncbi:hypothetical protein ABK040_002483 [Willaertia magna]
MVLAYYLNDKSRIVSLEELSSTVGVLYNKLNTDNYETEIEQISKERGYGHRSMVYLNPTSTPNLEELLTKFFEEHLHEYEEIRYIVEGSGVFDVRDKNDEWIRIDVEKGDLLVLPAGIYHRFTLDEKRNVVAMRLFLETMKEPVWTPFNRNVEGVDDFECRKQYVQQFDL